MKTRKLASTLGVLALIGGTAFVAAPAVATGNCTVVAHSNLGDVKVRNAADTADTTAKVTLTDSGVRVVLPDVDAKAYAYFPASVALAAVTAFSYQTKKYDTTTVGLPSGQLVLDFNGAAEGGFTTLVHEGYLNSADVSGVKTWPASAQKWWSTRVIPGQPDRATLRTLAEVVAANPDALVQAFGVNIGAGSPGSDVRWDRVRFASKGGCVEHRWVKPAPTPSVTPSRTVSPTPSVTSSKTAEPTATRTGSPSPTGSPSESESAGPVPTVSTSPASGGGGGLPLTGAPLLAIGGAAGLLIAVGGILLVLARRRRTRVIA